MPVHIVDAQHDPCPAKVALGEQKTKRGLTGILFGRLAKKMVFANKPMQKNLPTATDFKVANPGAFEQERKKLVSLVASFAEQGAGGITTAMHPILGTLTKEEWDYLNYKHLDHHLNQFGV